MAEERVSSISKASTLEKMAEFWDTHSLSDYDDQTYEVEMTFDQAARRTSVPLEPELWEDLHRVARERRVSLQTLVNVWLRQRVDQVEAPASLRS